MKAGGGEGGRRLQKKKKGKGHISICSFPIIDSVSIVSLILLQIHKIKCQLIYSYVQYKIDGESDKRG